MSRRQRSAYRPDFEDTREFDAQLYTALRRSPWWMISLAVHVLLFVISGLIADPTALPRRASPDLIVTSPLEPPVEPPKEPAEDEIDKIRPEDPENPVPQPLETVEMADKPETDNDLPFDEVLGSTEGQGPSDLTGLSNNPVIGVGSGFAAGRKGDRGGNDNRGGGGGGSRRGHDAVEHALRWLAAHQSPDGGWESEGFGRWCDGRRVAGGPDGAGKAHYDVGVTGLSLLAFLGAGYTFRGEHPFATTVSRGLRYLRNAQDAEGCIGSRAGSHYVYSHAIAALALVEGYGMTGSNMLKVPAQKSLDFIAILRNPYSAWRYGVKPGDNDTSVTGWMMMALKSARLVNEADVARGRPASLQIDPEAFDGIRSWIERMTDTDTGRVGYQQRGSGPARTPEMVDRFPAEKSESMTAVGVLARVFLGENPKESTAVKRGADLCARVLPRWDAADGSVDMYYWYYGTLAMFQVGGEPWKKWDAAMKPAIIDSQRMDGDYCGCKGSWDPIDPWGPDGGRVYSTATLAMCLEIYYRYDRVFGAK
jgi:hypothetical protein